MKKSIFLSICLALLAGCSEPEKYMGCQSTITEKEQLRKEMSSVDPVHRQDNVSGGIFPSILPLWMLMNSNNSITATNTAGFMRSSRSAIITRSFSARGGISSSGRGFGG